MNKLNLNRVLEFISGIALLIMGILSLFSRIFTLEVVSYMTVYSILFYGILQIALIFKADKDKKSTHLILGILLTTLGFVSLYNMGLTKVTVVVYTYIFFGISFIVMSATSLVNHIQNIRKHNLIIGILLIVFNLLLLVFSINLFFTPAAETRVISMFIALNLIFAGASAIGNSVNENLEPKDL
ncbi:hypothetical protein BN85404840 [Alteracholeplasma palmae J233]|uniref:DUF308 domain-containing protein n=1 Tax=Alteracholeplasma palmae (strain ATCC 49389 / J233) TaxID=1318466 RepID=U4KRD3_ALTPJ|nr:DUF308 domain-containing protein [Alteracholeplasma palmae]CCV64061.1 hypothetical protein BN85404840 [Alteracholeplasma palmae J233]